MREPDLVVQFLDQHHYWFADPGNMLFGKREAASRVLVDFLEDGEEHLEPFGGFDYLGLYLIHKFEREYFGRNPEE